MHYHGSGCIYHGISTQEKRHGAASTAHDSTAIVNGVPGMQGSLGRSRRPPFGLRFETKKKKVKGYTTIIHRLSFSHAGFPTKPSRGHSRDAARFFRRGSSSRVSLVVVSVHTFFLLFSLSSSPACRDVLAGGKKNSLVTQSEKSPFTFSFIFGATLKQLDWW